VKLSSLQKIADIRGNQPGISLLNFISMVTGNKAFTLHEQEIKVTLS